MILYILDTDHVTLLQRGHSSVVRKVEATPPSHLSTTLITAEEQIRGWLKWIRRASSAPDLLSAYARFRAGMEFYSTVPLLDFDSAAYRHYAALREEKLRIGTQDLRIGAIALSNKGVHITRNTRDFSKVPNLRFEDWSIE